METLNMKLFLIVTVFACSAFAFKHRYISNNLEPLTDEIVTAINALNSTWKAGNSLNGSPVQMDKLIVTREETFDNDFVNLTYPFKLRKHTPRAFDTREAWPNCTSIGRVYDQRKGVPSWVYTAVGTIADRFCIATGVQIDVETTVESITRSNPGAISEFNSANIGQAFSYWVKKGIFTVKSEKDSICLPLSTKCLPDKIQLDKHYKINVQLPDIWLDKMRDIMIYGPLPVYMRVYSDFLSYESGVYIRASRRYLGMHNIKLIGWGVDNGVHYWLATNSWGTEWGIEGVSKIRMQHADFAVNASTPSVTFEQIDAPLDSASYKQDQLFYLA